jgi:hypothetical protein
MSYEEEKCSRYSGCTNRKTQLMNNNIDTIDLEELFEHFRFEVPKGQTSLRIDKYLMSLIQNATTIKYKLQQPKEIFL